MNERLLSLAEQAGWTDEKYYSTQNKIYQWQNFNKEDFAKLIQQDVLQHLTNTGQDHAREILERYFAQR